MKGCAGSIQGSSLACFAVSDKKKIKPLAQRVSDHGDGELPKVQERFKKRSHGLFASKAFDQGKRVAFCKGKLLSLLRGSWKKPLQEVQAPRDLSGEAIAWSLDLLKKACVD